MRKIFIPFLLCLCITANAQEEEKDVDGCKDSKLFNRMPHTVLQDCSSNYDQMELKVGTDKTETKEGTRTSLQYGYTKDEATAPSFFQIVKNYENAVAKTGGKRLYYNSDGGEATLYTKSGGKDVYLVLLDASGAKKGCFQLTILEIEGMNQEITAGEMLEAINKNGSIALQINFETGKAAIKPESQTIVDQIAAMLKTDLSMKVSIEGHTDNTGNPATNKTLSDNRAKSVVTALVAKGIESSRLSSKGWGQEKPVADNSTEEGKARNRRVEIVKM